MNRYVLDPEEVNLDVLNEDMQIVAEVIGLAATVRLIEAVGGTRLQVQSPRPLWRAQARRRALRLYDGTNTVAVCRATGLSLRQLRRVLREAGPGNALETY